MTREEATPSLSITEVIENLEQMLYRESTSLSKRFTTKEIETLNTAINDLQFLNKVSLDLASENDELEEKLKQEPRKGHWISTSEELPNIDEDVLVTDIHGNITVYTLKDDWEAVPLYWEDDAGYYVDF